MATNILCITLVILMSALFLCIGMMVGMYMNEKINRDYINRIIEIQDDFTKNSICLYKEYIAETGDLLHEMIRVSYEEESEIEP